MPTTMDNEASYFCHYGYQIPFVSDCKPGEARQVALRRMAEGNSS